MKTEIDKILNEDCFDTIDFLKAERDSKEINTLIESKLSEIIKEIEEIQIIAKKIRIFRYNDSLTIEHKCDSILTKLKEI